MMPTNIFIFTTVYVCAIIWLFYCILPLFYKRIDTGKIKMMIAVIKNSVEKMEIIRHSESDPF